MEDENGDTLDQQEQEPRHVPLLSSQPVPKLAAKAAPTVEERLTKLETDYALLVKKLSRKVANLGL